MNSSLPIGGEVCAYNAWDNCLEELEIVDGILFERPHFQLICAALSDDYTEVNGEYSVHYDGLLPPLTREAPTYFERSGK